MPARVPACWCRWLLAFLLIAEVVAPVAAADDKKKPDPPKPEPPRLLLSVPGGVVTGVSYRVALRGLNLTNTLRLWIAETSAPVTLTWGKAVPAKVPDKADPKKIGDTQIDVQLQLPANWVGPTLSILASNAVGSSAPVSLRVASAGVWRAEKEPNGGFAAPQTLALPAAVPGTIDPAQDVDVYRIQGRAGQWLTVEIFGARQGSPLDAILTLYNERGSVLRAVDDGPAGRDPALKFRLPADGTYFLGVNDAHDTGGPLHVYWLEVRVD